jgi:hypothetical protein
MIYDDSNIYLRPILPNNNSKSGLVQSMPEEKKRHIKIIKKESKTDV